MLTMTAIFSRFSLPVMCEGSTMIFTATTVPRQVALNTCSKTKRVTTGSGSSFALKSPAVTVGVRQLSRLVDQ